MRRAAVLPEKGKRRRDPARGLREISLAQGAPEGISALLRPAARGAAGVRAGHGHRTITVSKHRAGIGPSAWPRPWSRALLPRRPAHARPSVGVGEKGPPQRRRSGTVSKASALQKTLQKNLGASRHAKSRVFPPTS